MVHRRRQWRAENQDIYIKEKLRKNRYLISGNRGIDYQVDLSKPDCECPDWQTEKPKGGCKHILKIKLKEGAINPLPSAKTNFGSERSRSAGDYPSNWSSLRKRTLKRDNWKCQSCGNSGGEFGDATLQAHHIIPKSKGGDDKLSNLITLCLECHETEHGHSISSGESSGFSESNHTNVKGGREPDEISMSDYLSGNNHTETDFSDSDINQSRWRTDRAWVGSTQKWWHFVALADLRKAYRYRRLSINFVEYDTQSVTDSDDENSSDSATAIEFTGTVVQTGNPIVINNGKQTYSVESNKSVRLGQQVTAYGKIDDSDKIIAESLEIE